MEVWNKYQNTIKKIVLIVFLFAFIYLSFTYLLPFFAPFVIAMIASYINEPLIKLLIKFKMSRKLAAVIALLLTILLLVFGIFTSVVKVYQELSALQENVSVYSSDVSVRITDFIYKVTQFYNDLPDEISSAITKNLSEISTQITGLITTIMQYAINTVSSIPTLTVFIIVTILATYFISSDRHKIYSFIYRQLPLKWRNNVRSLKKGTFRALFGYFKAILILMGITFLEVSIGLFILDVKYAFLMALLVGIAEAIPIFGTGIIMIPWILWHFFTGNMPMAFGLAIIYILGILIRQIMEPKVVGSQIGLHPLITLLAMYVGLKFFGVLGMILGPIAIIIVKNFQDSGVVKLWND